MIRRTLREALGLPSRVELDSWRRRMYAERERWAEERRTLTARAVAAETELELEHELRAEAELESDDLERRLELLRTGDSKSWAELGFVPASHVRTVVDRERGGLACLHSKLAELEAERRGRVFPLRVSEDGFDVCEIDVESYGVGPELDLGDHFPGLLTLRRTDPDGTGHAATYLRDEIAIHRGMRARIEELKAERYGWRSEVGRLAALVQTIDEALDRLGVPGAPDAMRAADRLADDDAPRPGLVWRLSWLEGAVAALRLNQKPTTEEAEDYGNH
jgi:hypothetical protein